MENNIKQKKCAAALILLTVLSRNNDWECITKEFGKLTLFYSNDTNHFTLNYLEEELANLFELFLRRIHKLCCENDVNSMIYSDFDLLGEINDSIYRTKQIDSSQESNPNFLAAFKKLLQDICSHLSV